MLAAQASGPVFKPGDRIVHSILGSGAVVDIEHDKAAYVIKFDDLGTMRKINFKASLRQRVLSMETSELTW